MERPMTRPVGAKAVSEASILNRELRLNGSAGSMRVERVGRGDLKATVSFEGTRLSRPGEACTVKLDDAVSLKERGQPEGLLRYEFQAPACPVMADLLDGALWVRGPVEACSFEAADCRVDPRGLWGPEPAALAAQARGIEHDRGQADRAVRENYKALTQRAHPQDVRAIVSEQAAFSSEREMMCRGYAREAAHGFCNARFTEARAAQLAARLGLVPAASARATPAQRRPVPASAPVKPPMPLLPSQE
jgi:hypothetical protein